MQDRSQPWIGTLVALILGACVVLPLHAQTSPEGTPDPSPHRSGVPIGP